VRRDPRLIVTTHPLRGATNVAVALAIWTLASVAHGQVYKCTDGNGKTTYSGTPCDGGTKPLRLPDDPKTSVASPHMCAQLLDETSRLAAESDRDAKNGRTETADHSKRRQAMKTQYEARCVGIARSGPKPN
jgi:hypothetical protein